MNCFTPDKPKVVILETKGNAGESIIEIANNIDPKLEVVICTSVEDFKEQSLGLPFNTSQQ